MPVVTTKEHRPITMEEHGSAVTTKEHSRVTKVMEEQGLVSETILQQMILHRYCRTVMVINNKCY